MVVFNFFAFLVRLKFQVSTSESREKEKWTSLPSRLSSINLPHGCLKYSSTREFIWIAKVVQFSGQVYLAAAAAHFT